MAKSKKVKQYIELRKQLDRAKKSLAKLDLKCIAAFNECSVPERLEIGSYLSKKENCENGPTE